MTRPDRSLPRRQAPPLFFGVSQKTRPDERKAAIAPPGASRDQAPPGLGVGSLNSCAAYVPGSRSGRYRSETSLCAAAGSGYRPGPRHLLIPESGQRSALAVRRGWFPVVGVRRTTPTASGSRAGREQRSAFWRVFRRRSPVHLWAARPDGGTLSRSIFPGAEDIRLSLLRSGFLKGRLLASFPFQNQFLHFHFYHHRGMAACFEFRRKAFNSLFPEFLKGSSR